MNGTLLPSGSAMPSMRPPSRHSNLHFRSFLDHLEDICKILALDRMFGNPSALFDPNIAFAVFIKTEPRGYDGATMRLYIKLIHGFSAWCGK